MECYIMLGREIHKEKELTMAMEFYTWNTVS